MLARVHCLTNSQFTMKSSVSAFLQLLTLVTLFGSIYNSQLTSVRDGWELYVSNFQLPWKDSQDYCGTLNMTLLSVDTVEKDRVLVDFFVNGNGTDLLLGNAWTSAIELVEGVWNWDSTKQPIYHTRWFVGQPDDLTDLNCVYLAKTALLYWRDANCSAPMYFICE